MTLKQALEITLFKNCRVYIEKDNKLSKIESLDDLDKYNLEHDVDIIERGLFTTTIKL